MPGFAYDDDALDVGAGMRPTLTGQGQGGARLRAILAWGEERFAPRAFRATIASWNERALRAAAHAGFAPHATFLSPEGMEFTVLVREVRGGDG